MLAWPQASWRVSVMAHPVTATLICRPLRFIKIIGGIGVVRFSASPANITAPLHQSPDERETRRAKN
jgi:hypothetical protein